MSIYLYYCVYISILLCLYIYTTVSIYLYYYVYISILLCLYIYTTMSIYLYYCVYISILLCLKLKPSRRPPLVQINLYPGIVQMILVL